MARELDLKRKYSGFESEMVSRADRARGSASDLYHGGAIIPGLGSLHPGLYHAGLLSRVVSAGAVVIRRAAVTGIRRESDGFDVATARGILRVRDVAVATNGYTGRATPWLRRRVVPFRAFMIATEELPDAQLARILPENRTAQDFNNNLIYRRRAPDAPRLLLGGMTGTLTDNLRKMAQRLHRKLTAVIPELKAARLSRAWHGFGGGTFDLNPHVRTHNGVHYVTGAKNRAKPRE